MWRGLSTQQGRATVPVISERPKLLSPYVAFTGAKKSRNPLTRQAVLKRVSSNETCFKLREMTRVLGLRNIEGLSQGYSLGNEICHSANMGAF
jgi:hypothetical protein